MPNTQPTRLNWNIVQGQTFSMSWEAYVNDDITQPVDLRPYDIRMQIYSRDGKQYADLLKLAGAAEGQGFTVSGSNHNTLILKLESTQTLPMPDGEKILTGDWRVELAGVVAYWMIVVINVVKTKTRKS